MKKLKLLRQPVRLNIIQLDDLEYDAAPRREAKVARSHARRMRQLRAQTV